MRGVFRKLKGAFKTTITRRGGFQKVCGSFQKVEGVFRKLKGAFKTHNKL